MGREGFVKQALLSNSLLPPRPLTAEDAGKVLTSFRRSSEAQNNFI